MSNITKILDLIKALSVVELNELVKAVEEEFGVSAAAGVVVAGPAAAGAGDDAAAKDSVKVELAEVGQQKIAVIKVVKELLGCDLKAAKDDFVEKAPIVLKENVKLEEAEAMKAKLEEAGAKVNFK
ncbi:MAG: 50S ribosomal protein L7/L12 [Candidatus Absconditabacterales bacterium]